MGRVSHSVSAQSEGGVLKELEGLLDQFFSGTSSNEQKQEISTYNAPHVFCERESRAAAVLHCVRVVQTRC